MYSSVGFLSPFPPILVTYGNKCVVRQSSQSKGAIGGSTDHQSVRQIPLDAPRVKYRVHQVVVSVHIVSMNIMWRCCIWYDCVSLAVGGWVLGEELRCESLYLSVALWHCDRCGWLLAVVVGCCLCLGLLVGFVPPRPADSSVFITRVCERQWLLFTLVRDCCCCFFSL